MILSDEERAFAESHRVAHLATADGSGAPHVVPLCYALDGGSLYFVVDEKPKATKRLKRMRNLEANPRAAVVIDDYDDAWARLAYLLIEGPTSIVDDPHEYERVVVLLRRRYRLYTDMALSMAANPMVRVTIQRSHFWAMKSR